MGVATVFGAGSATAAEACRVNFSDIQLERFTNGGTTFDRVRLTGEHNYSAASGVGGPETTRFEVVDPDGFFILAVFSNRWFGSDRRVPRGEVEALRRAMEMGIAYYERGRVITSEARPENLTDALLAIDTKLALQRQILSTLNEAGDYQQSDDRLLVRDLFGITFEISKFRFGAERELASRYRDFAVEGGAPEMLCDPDARSLIVGLLACHQIDLFDPTVICPEGVSFSPILLPRPQSSSGGLL